MQAPDGDVPTSQNEAQNNAEAPPEVARRASSIARQTMSPFCPGRTLADCPSEYAAEWREDIRRMVQEGKSSAEIQAELSQRAGGDLSGIPNRETSYALPAAFAVLAGGVLFFVFRRLRVNAAKSNETSARRTAGETTATSTQVDDTRLQQELEAEDEET